MSLTQFLKQDNIKSRLNKEVRKINLLNPNGIIVTPKSKRYLATRLAFNYLLDFYVLRLNRIKHNRKWIAEYAMITSIKNDTALNNAKEMVEEAKSNLKSYLDNGRITNNLIISARELADLEYTYITHQRPSWNPHLSKWHVYNNDITDLKRMFLLLDSRYFTAKDTLEIQPDFADAALMVAGTSASLILDDTIIEVKTTKTLKLTPEYLHLMVGFYLLNEINRKQGAKVVYNIENIAIYFARFQKLVKISIHKVIMSENEEELRDWLEKEAGTYLKNLSKMSLRANLRYNLSS